MCKCNCASLVKINSPRGRPGYWGKNEEARVSIVKSGQYSLGVLRFRFCLTSLVRPNYYYTPERPNGQTQPARSEDRRSETNWHVQSPCRSRDRSAVPTESLLRSPRSSAGSLRDAATPHRRTDVDSRCRCRFWRLTSYVLSGPCVFPTIGTGGPIACSARTEGWAQADHRSPRLCRQFAGVRSQAHDRAVRQSYSRAFCNYHPPAQPRAGSGAAQKKTAWPDLRTSVPDDAVTAYEALRPYLIDPANLTEAAGGRTVLLRQGMLAWASASRQVPACWLLPSPADRSPIPSEVSRELVQVMAGLILHHGKDSVHA